MAEKERNGRGEGRKGREAKGKESKGSSESKRRLAVERKGERIRKM